MVKRPNFRRPFLAKCAIREVPNTLPRVRRDESSLDRFVLGRNIRELRRVRGWSIDMLAKRAGVAPYTVLRMEQGLPSTESRRTRIAYALDTVVERLSKVGALGRNDVAVHTAADDSWMGLIDRRLVIPDDNDELVQSADERGRLGRLGFVTQFVKVLRCRLPKGKLLAGILEIYADLPASKYLGGEIFAFALRRDSYLNLDGERFLLVEGSATTFDCTKPFFFSPAGDPSAGEEPALVLYVRLEEVYPIESRKPKRGQTLDGRYQVWAEPEETVPNQMGPIRRPNPK